MKLGNCLLKNVVIATACIASLVGYCRPVQAGFTANWIGGKGYSASQVIARTGTKTSIAMNGTSAILAGKASTATPPAGYQVNAPLPSGASAASYSRASASSLYVIQGGASNNTGDSADNKEIDKKVTINAAPCPVLDVATEFGSFDPVTGNGTIKVITGGTAGSALLLRGFEVTDANLVPEDDLSTPDIDERIEWAKQNAVLKFENLLIGPFVHDASCPLIIYFTLEGKDENKLIFAVDGETKSSELNVVCPGPQTASCLTGYQYPDVDVTGACGTVEVVYSPAENLLVPGVNVVTVTATDEAGVSDTCTFNVTVGSLLAPTLPDIKACAGPITPVAPKIQDACNGTITGTTTTTFPITAVGTTTVTWTFTNPQGHTVTADQKVIISGLTFVGFYAPIAAKDGTCAKPAKVIKIGSNTPIKFDMKCGTTSITTGTPPTVQIQQLSGNCGVIATPVDVPAVFQNDWHINWDSTGWPAGNYKIIASLPDGTKGFVIVQLKK